MLLALTKTKHAPQSAFPGIGGHVACDSCGKAWWTGWLGAAGMGSHPCVTSQWTRKGLAVRGTILPPPWAPASPGQGLAEGPWVAVLLEGVPSVAAGPPGAVGGDTHLKPAKVWRGARPGEAP